VTSGVELDPAELDPVHRPATGPAAPSPRLSVFTKLSYGFGEMAEGVKSATLETFLFFYYVQVLGLSGTLTGVALMIALVFDGVIDPVIGQISDRARTRLGRRHPFLYAAPIPLAICLIALFSPPAGLGQWGLFGWILVFAVLSRAAQSVYFVPHMALGAELSTDFRERISVAAYRSNFSFIGRIIAVYGAFAFFFAATPAFRTGQMNPAAYPPMAVAAALMAASVIVLSALGTQRRTVALYKARLAEEPPHATPILASLTNAFRLRTFAIYFTAVLINYILGGVQAALGVHLNTFYWRLPTSELQTVLLGNTIGFIFGALLARPLADRLDKKRTYVACLVGSVLMGSLPILLAELHILPTADRHQLAWFLTGFNICAGLIGGPAVVVAGAMLADVADVYQLRFKARSEGFLFGASAFTRKASVGVGQAIAGIALDLVAFPRGVGPEHVTRSDALNVALLWGPGVLCFSLTAAVIMSFYDLDRRKHAEVQKQLGITP